MKQYLSVFLVAVFALLCIPAMASGDVYCRVNDSSVTQISTKLPGIQTVDGVTYHVGVEEVLHYDNHDSLTPGVLTTADNIPENGSGWLRYSMSDVSYQKDAFGDTATVFSAKAGGSDPMAFYTFRKANAYTGKVSVEYKIKAENACKVDMRLISGGANNNGWANIYQTIYGILEFSENKFTFYNVSRKADNSGDDVNTYTANAGLHSWITLRMNLDIHQECFDLFVNGESIATKLPFHYATLPKELRNDAQNAVDSVGYLRIYEAREEGTFLIDDIAVYDTDSETTQYFGALPSDLSYDYYTNAVLSDAKVSVSIVDQNGVSTGKTAFVPVRLSGLDSSEFGILKATIDGYSEQASVVINKKSEITIDDFESYNITDAVNGLPLSVSGHSIQKETDSDNISNQYLKIYKGCDWSAFSLNQALNPGKVRFEFGCRVRFPDISGFSEGQQFLSLQLNEGYSINIATLNIEPEYGALVENTRKRLRVTLPASTNDASLAQEKVYSLFAPYYTDWSEWHTVVFRFADGKMQIAFDGRVLSADGGDGWEKVRTDIDFRLFRLAHRTDAALKIDGISNVDDITLTVYPEVMALDNIIHTTSISNLSFPKTVSVSLTDGTNAVLPIRSFTPVGNAPDIENITECGNYQYRIAAEGTEKTALLTLTVIEKAYSLGTPYTDENTGHIVVPVFKATTDAGTLSLITALYQGSRLCDISILPVSGSGNLLTPLKLTSGATVKVFLWNDTAQLTPACSAKEEDLTPVIPESIETYDIVCWGDSLTYGQIDGASPETAYSYPTVLAALTGKTVKNMGIGGETAQTIAVRQGGLTLAPSGPFTLGGAKGSSVTFTEGEFQDLTGGNIVPRANYGLYSGWEGICYLNTIPGRITKLEVDASVQPRKLTQLTFTRLEDGEPLVVNEGQRSVLIPNGTMVKGDINVIFVGENGWHDANHDGSIDEKDLIFIIDSMIAKTPNPQKTIVIGMQTGDRESRKEMEEAMLLTYGERYINLREHLSSSETLQAAGITPTREDLEKIAIGAMPKSLWNSATDYVHMNQTGYSILANKVYQKLMELNFLQ